MFEISTLYYFEMPTAFANKSKSSIINKSLLHCPGHTAYNVAKSLTTAVYASCISFF